MPPSWESGSASDAVARGVVSSATVRSLVLGRFGQKIEKNRFLKDTAKKTNKNKKRYKGGDALGRRYLLSGRICLAWAGLFNLTGPVFLSYGKRNRTAVRALGFALAASLAPLVPALGLSPRPWLSRCVCVCPPSSDYTGIALVSAAKVMRCNLYSLVMYVDVDHFDPISR